ncbi:M28 family metallopeptidase [Neisseriaceae bacterium JH1-16]|nr:M28 family metallopeptidase [Neisseriaceae bacterium JH1-16]
MSRLKPLFVLIAGFAVSGTVHARSTVWITLGDDAYLLLRQISPQTKSNESRQLNTGIVARSLTGQSVPVTEKVHVVEVDESLLPKLSDAIHDKRRHCGGFIVHGSQTEARVALAPAPKLAGTVAPNYQINDQVVVNKLLPQLQDSNILGTIQTLSGYQNRFYATSHGQAASDWIASNWKQLAGGRSDVTIEQVAHSGYPQKSVVLTIKGKDNAAEELVLGAHLDSTIGSGTGENSRAPGADDDASGVASLTEVIRVLMANNYQPRRTIKFMAYAAEEVGLRGSNDIATRHKQQKTNVVGVLQLDMTNYQGNAEDIFIYTDYTNAAQNAFLADLIKTYQPALKVGYDQCGYACSDHASWNKQGYVASLPFESSFSNYNPYIHTSKDTLANMGNQAQHALKFTKLALSYAVELGSDGPALKAR